MEKLSELNKQWQAGNVCSFQLEDTKITHTEIKGVFKMKKLSELVKQYPSNHSAAKAFGLHHEKLKRALERDAVYDVVTGDFYVKNGVINLSQHA